MELNKLEKFYCTHSKFYDSTRPFFLVSRNKALSMLNFDENDKVLDLACGTGLNIPHIAKVVRLENIVGIDYSESMLARARSKFPEIRFVQGDVSNYILGKKFDKIVCTYSLSMIEQWKETIQNASRHLAHNGTFLLLDFHPWNRTIKLFYPMCRAWLEMHGVDSDRDYLPELRKNVRDVEENVVNLGYNQVVIAKHLKIINSDLKGGIKWD